MGFNFHRWSIFNIFAGLIFADADTHTHYVLYIQTFFACLIFAVRQSSTKTVKIWPLENFPLYGTSCTIRKCIRVVVSYNSSNCRQLELYRAHTPPHFATVPHTWSYLIYLSCSIYMYIWRSLRGKLYTWTEHTWPAVVQSMGWVWL